MALSIKPRMYFFALLPLLLAGCKLDKPDLSGTTPMDSLGTGGNLSNTYQPVSKGTYWKYIYIFNGVTDSMTSTMTGNSIVINGRTNYEGISILHSQPSVPVTGYLSNSGHIYINLSEDPEVDLYYLNDTTAAGSGWTVPINPSGKLEDIPGQFVGKIIEKGISKTVGGKTFTNVIHSQVELQYDYGTGFSTALTYDNYCAKGVGLIEIDSNGEGIAVTETLFDYSIK